MLLPIKRICEFKKIRKDGTSIIFIQYCFSTTKRTLLNTGLSIPPKYWDDFNQGVMRSLPPVFGDAAKMNTELKRMFRSVEDIVDFALARNESDPVEFLKKLFTPNFNSSELDAIVKKMESTDEKTNLDVYFQFDEYVKSRMSKVTPNMKNIYHNTKERLKSFEAFRKKPITFDSFDYNFYEEFVEYMMYHYVQRRYKERRGLKVNTIGCTIKQLRIFLKNRVKKKIVPVIDMDGWTILEEEADTVYLNWDEIMAIYALDLSRLDHLEPYRNDFVLGCLTGLRFSDFSKLTETDVRGDMLYKKQQKSNHWVVVPLRPEARKILTNRFNQQTGILTNAEFNRHIKSIAKLAGITQPVTHSHKEGNKQIVETKPKFQWVTSHTCRRSFCTNEFLAGTPVELIMKISGHKSVKDFYKYIRVSPEQAATKMKELWEARPGLTISSPLKAKAS
jgi:site-specific recombinase XerD